VQTRYRMEPVRAHVIAEGNGLTVELEEPVLGVAPGQAVVCYLEDIILGGGTMERAR